MPDFDEIRLWTGFKQKDGLASYLTGYPHPHEILHQTPSSVLISVPDSVARNIDAIRPTFYTFTLPPAIPNASYES